MEISLPSSMLWNRAALVRWCNLPQNEHLRRQSNCLYTLELSVKSCPVPPELQPSFDVSSSPDCYSQSHEILLNKGMKFWDSGLNARRSKTFIVTVHIAASVIDWRRSGKEKSTGRTQFSTKFGTKLSFISYPVEAQLYVFFGNLIPCVTKRGVPVPFFPTLRITLVCWIKYSSLQVVFQLSLGPVVWNSMRSIQRRHIALGWSSVLDCPGAGNIWIVSHSRFVYFFMFMSPDGE
jgi:hypothetical protein